MAMVNPHPVINPNLFNPNAKDSRWLTLEVCREFVRQKCTRTENECKFAHPPPHVEVQNGRVTCCFDSIKGKCQRKEPPCKYLHPPQHLKEQLLQNGRNNLILKNLQMQALAAGLQPMVPGVFPTVMYDAGGQKAVPYPGSTVLPGQFSPLVQTHPFLMQNTGAPSFNPYLSPQLAGIPGMVPAVDTSQATAQGVPVSAATAPTVPGMVPNPAIANAQKIRADRLEHQSSSSICNGSEGSSVWTGSQGESSGLVTSSNTYSPVYFQQQMGMPGMVPVVKRPAVADNKSGVPVYQPSTNTAAYQQAALAAMQMQQPFVPVTIAGHPPGMQRF